MTLVDFYILDNDSADARLRHACRLVEAAVEKNLHVFIHSDSDADARKLDELLWTFSQGSFIPHRVLRDAPQTPPIEPVLIGVNLPPVGERWDLLVNLAADVPEFFSRYERVAEFVERDPAQRGVSREHYRFYRDRGYNLTTHAS